MEKNNIELLDRARQSWAGLQTFRESRERCKRFTYGDQWNDMVDDRGVRMTEEEFIRSQGNMPLKNNLIRRLVRNVLGVYRNQYKLPQTNDETLNSRLKSNASLNRLPELYARTMEEFLISGLAVHKKWTGRRNGRMACWTDNISPARFFFDNSSRDFRGFDLNLVGEIHELPLSELIVSFARTPEDIRFIAERFGNRHEYSNSMPPAEADLKITVWEIWERHRRLMLSCHDTATGKLFRADPDREDDVRSKYKDNVVINLVTEEYWTYSFMTADGTLLREGISPYTGYRHPYVFKAYPYIDGEIHSFVADIIDQQKLTNRLISMYDWILRASAKGVLLFPEGSMPDGVDFNDVIDEWSRFNGVIVYRPRPGVPMPQQISSNSTDIGITGLLEIQMKMMEDISGVNGALQGKLDSSSMSGTLYNQQTQNSLTALADLLSSYNDFVACGTQADIENLKAVEDYTQGADNSLIKHETHSR